MEKIDRRVDLEQGYQYSESNGGIWYGRMRKNATMFQVPSLA
jgi:hypothetical protein